MYCTCFEHVTRIYKCQCFPVLYCISNSSFVPVRHLLSGPCGRSSYATHSGGQGPRSSPTRRWSSDLFFQQNTSCLTVDLLSSPLVRLTLDADPQAGRKETTIQLRGGKPAGGRGARNRTARDPAQGPGASGKALIPTLKPDLGREGGGGGGKGGAGGKGWRREDTTETVSGGGARIVNRALGSITEGHTA